MSLKEMLLQEQSKKQCDKIVRFIGKDRKRFAELMKLFFDGEYRLTQRAAWPMSYCVRKKPALISPYIGKIIRSLPDRNLHDAVIRNSVRLLQWVDVPRKFHGELMNSCFAFLQSPETAIAIKAFSLSILENLSNIYPEIIPEIKVIIEDRWDYESPAFRTRAGKFYKMNPGPPQSIQ